MNDNAHTKVGELAFEHGFSDSLPTLWRVVTNRSHSFKSGVRVMRHTNWYAKEAEARKHADYCVSCGDELLSITEYREATP
jgi:hypothetical protein